MTLREALAGIPDPRGKNRQFPLSGLLALILVAFLCRVDSLRGVARFARANPHLLPHLGLRRPPGHYALTTLLHRLDPRDLQEASARVFPEVPVSPGERGKGGAYLLAVKGNQGEMLAWLREVFAGMRERRLPGETAWLREEERDGEVRRYRVWASPHLPAEADAEVLGRWFLGRWEIENGSFWVRDVLFREDGCQVRGRGAEVLAGLRGFLVSLLHGRGIRQKKVTLERFSFHPLEALRFLGWDAV